MRSKYTHTSFIDQLNSGKQTALEMYIHVFTFTFYVHTDFNLFHTAFCGQQRDAVRSDNPAPSPAVEDGGGGCPCPEDGVFFYARPDAAEIEEAIRKFGVQERSCYHELHSLLSKVLGRNAAQRNGLCTELILTSVAKLIGLL
jgi:hypothetical protein